MKLVIFGSRPQYCPLNLNQQVKLIEQAVDKFDLFPLEVVTGLARGIDSAAIVYARSRGIQIKGFKAEWSKYPRAAGMIRNKNMAMYADVGLGLQWGDSPGTAHMIDTMKSLKKLCYTVFEGNLDYAF